jgi:uncharacterized PurR-regulated membrane protein YhhQ (DUF165 family)
MTRRTLVGWLVAGAYVATVWLANIAVAHLGVVSVGFGLVAPAGVYLAGLAFTLRDVLQDFLGRRAVVAAILTGAVLSYLLGAGNTIPGGHASIAVASAAAFLVSESSDFAVYTPLRERSWLGAVALSNTAGAVIDSVVFLWLAFGGFAFLKGQIVGKLWITALSIVVLRLLAHQYATLMARRTAAP